MSSQSRDIYKKKTKLTLPQKRNPSCVKQGFHLHRHHEMLEDDISHASTSR